jgi:hypothetical protein
VSALSGRYTFTITIASGCAWTATTDVSWADVAPGSGQGNGTPMLNVNENPNRDARTVTVSVNSQSFRVTQNAVGCGYALNPSSIDAGAEGGGASVVLTATAGCLWTAVASESWIRVLTPNGTGSGTVNLDIASNSSDVRHAFVTIAGQRVNITQQRR